MRWRRARPPAGPTHRPETDDATRVRTERYDADLVVPRHEAWNVTGVTVHGRVRVEPGASLRLTGCAVHGQLEVAVSSLVIVQDSRIDGHVTLTPDPVETVGAPARGGTALLGTRVGGDVRSTGLAGTPASVILGESTVVDGSALTAHTDLVDQGAVVRVTVWNTGSAADHHPAGATATIDLTGPVPVYNIMDGIAS